MFVATVLRLDEVDSTSDLARQMVMSGDSAMPLLVRARRQTKGRGRGANAWWSDAGSLTFTLAIDPAAHGLTPTHEPRLALTAAVAMIEVIDRLTFTPIVGLGIRWPNDIEAPGGKLGGILPERVETPRGVRLLIGVGLNVATRLDDAPREVRRMAASLADFGKPPELDAVLRGWLERFDRALVQLARDDPELSDRWSGLDTLRGRSVRVDVGPRVIAGCGGGIDAEGALIVADDAEIHRLFGCRVLRG